MRPGLSMYLIIALALVFPLLCFELLVGSGVCVTARPLRSEEWAPPGGREASSVAGSLRRRAIAIAYFRPWSSGRRRAGGAVVDARRVDRRPELSHTSTYVYRTVETGPMRKTPLLAPRCCSAALIARPSVHRRGSP